MAKSSLPTWMLLAANLLLLGGCVPGTHVDASPVAGRVVDRATRRPIGGAKVVLNTFGPDHEAQTTTDQDGRFHLAGFRHVEFTPLPYSMFRAPTGHLRVEAVGYRPYGCGEFYDQNGKHPGYLNQEGEGLGSVQHVPVALVREGGRHTSAGGN